MGSDCSLIKESDAIKVVGTWDTSKNQTLAGFGGAQINSLGSFEASIELQGIKETIDLIVVPDVYLKCSLLIGQNFTELPFIQIKKTNSELIITREKCIPDKLKLLVSENCHLKPGVNTIDVYSKTTYSGPVFVNGGVRSIPDNEYYLENGVYSLKNGRGMVLVVNIGSNTIPFEKTQLLARAHCLNLVDTQSCFVKRNKNCWLV